jgi:hypothetical protein
MAKKSAAKKASAPAASKPETAKVKKLEPVSVGGEFDALSEDMLRDRAAQDMADLAAGKKVKTQQVTLAYPAHIRELGGKVPVDTYTLPESVVAFYARSRKGIFGETKVTHEGKPTQTPSGASDDGQGGASPETKENAPEAAKNDATGVQEGDDINNNHSPEGTAAN